MGKLMWHNSGILFMLFMFEIYDKKCCVYDFGTPAVLFLNGCVKISCKPSKSSSFYIFPLVNYWETLIIIVTVNLMAMESFPLTFLFSFFL